MKKAIEIIDDIVKNIPDYCRGNQLKTFTYVYAKVAHLLIYDELAASLASSNLAGYQRDTAHIFVIDPASNIECLESGKALCSGYARVLKHILNDLGIETIIVTSKGIHKWNQVLIDDIWYNCDLTNDSDFILEGLKCPHFLKSNDEDCNFKLGYPTSDFKECTSTVSEEIQEQLLNEAMEYIKMEIEKDNAIDQKSEIDDKPGFIKRLLAIFSKEKGGIKK